MKLKHLWQCELLITLTSVYNYELNASLNAMCQPFSDLLLMDFNYDVDSLVICVCLH